MRARTRRPRPSRSSAPSARGAEAVGVLDVEGAAVRGRADRLAPRRRAVRDRDEVARPEVGIGDRVVGADELGATREGGVAVGRVSGASLLGVRVGAGPDDEPLRHELADPGAVSDRIVELDDGRLRLGWLRAGEEHAAAERRMARDVVALHAAAVVEPEDDASAELAERRPAAALLDRFEEGRVIAADLVRRDDVTWSEHAPDLLVE